MKALIIDSEELPAGMLKSRLEPLDYVADIELSKDRAIGILEAQRYDLIFVDPAPKLDGRGVIQNIRRCVGRGTYIFLLSPSATQDEAIAMGANDVMAKPLDPIAFEEQIGNARRLSEIVDALGDISEDFPSAGGVISKSAFNQLFLSGIDRAERYGERIFVLFIALSNYEDIRKFDGPMAADFGAAKLSQHLVDLRRQTDIIGQTKSYEFALLLQRPERESEPVEAAARFAQSLSKMSDMSANADIKINMSVSLVGLPVGSLSADFSLSV